VSDRAYPEGLWPLLDEAQRHRRLARRVAHILRGRQERILGLQRADEGERWRASGRKRARGGRRTSKGVAIASSRKAIES